MKQNKMNTNNKKITNILRIFQKVFNHLELKVKNMMMMIIMIEIFKKIIVKIK